MEYALIDSLKTKVEKLAVPKGDLMDNYLHHLSANPERVDSILLLFFWTLAMWFILWRYRERFLTGLAGDGGHPGSLLPDNLDAREQLIFIYYFIMTLAINYGLFFRDLQTYQFAIICIVVAPGFYQIFGRFIFDWILAVRSGQPIKQSEPDVKTTTTTTTKTE